MMEQLNKSIQDIYVNSFDKHLNNMDNDYKGLYAPYKRFFNSLIVFYSSLKIIEPEAIKTINIKDIDNVIKENSDKLNSEQYKIIKNGIEKSVGVSYLIHKAIQKEFFNEKIDIDKPSEKFVKDILKYPFKGSTFDNRIYHLSDNLNFNVKQIITDGIQNGISPKNVAQRLNKELNISINKAQTIARTESTRAFNQTRFHELQNDKYIDSIIIISTLDDRTSGICREKDGKIIKKDNLKIENIPPFHPNCRSAIGPYVKEIPTRLNNIDKKQIEFITYKEFEKKYLV